MENEKYITKVFGPLMENGMTEYEKSVNDRINRFLDGLTKKGYKYRIVNVSSILNTRSSRSSPVVEEILYTIIHVAYTTKE